MIAFKSVKPLPAGVSLSVSVGPNIPSESGPLLGDQQLKRAFEVTPPLAVQFKTEYLFTCFIVLSSLTTNV